jgi:DNA-binding NarL/FixJ family response regulator
VFAFRLDHRLSRLVKRDPALRAGLADLMEIVHGPLDEEEPRYAGYLTDLESLTPREREVLPLVAEGKTNKEIATVLFLTEGTVKVHVRHILQKLGARSRTEAAIYAIRMQQREAATALARTSEPEQRGSST